MRSMRVKYVRKNANGLGLGRPLLRETNYLYDSRGPENNKDYGSKNRFLTLGHEANVYAISIRRDCTSFYIKEPHYNTVTHFPSICFDIIDKRISKYWQIKSNIVPPTNGNFPEPAFERTVFAIAEWIEEPRFLEYLVDDKERELGIMNAMIKLMDEEFLPGH